MITEARIDKNSDENSNKDGHWSAMLFPSSLNRDRGLSFKWGIPPSVLLKHQFSPRSSWTAKHLHGCFNIKIHFQSENMLPFNYLKLFAKVSTVFCWKTWRSSWCTCMTRATSGRTTSKRPKNNCRSLARQCSWPSGISTVWLIWYANWFRCFAILSFPDFSLCWCSGADDQWQDLFWCQSVQDRNSSKHSAHLLLCPSLMAIKVTFLSFTSLWLVE